MKTLRSVVLLAAALLVTSGCAATAARNGGADGPEVGRPERMMIGVTNYYTSEVIVYAEHAGSRARLGRVGAMQTVRFQTPRAFASNGEVLRIVVRKLGGQAEFITGPIRVYRNQEVQLEVENNLEISHWAVWLK